MLANTINGVTHGDGSFRREGTCRNITLRDSRIGGSRFRQEQATTVHIEFGTVAADAHKDHAIGNPRAFADALAIDDHEAMRGIVGIHVHADFQCGQAIAFVGGQVA